MRITNLKKIFPIFFSLLFLGMLNVSYAQDVERCQTDAINAKRKGVVLPMGKTALLFEQWLKKKAQREFQLRSVQNEEVFTIPVIVHIVHFGEEVGVETNIPAEQVYSQIKVLNQDFNRLNADTVKTPDMFKPVAGNPGFIFRPALYDTTGNLLPEPGIHRVFSENRLWSPQQMEEDMMPATAWNTSQYLNIWVVNLNANNIGFAYYPVGAPITGLTPDLEFSTETYDGAVIDYRHFGSNFTGDGEFDLSSRYNRGRTTTHEVAHWLGARHTWGDERFACNIDDFCDDTPRTTETSSGIGGDCANEENSCIDIPEDLPDMLQNFMTYADDKCMNLFTKCQSEKMRTVIQFAVRRQSIIEEAPDAPLNLSATFTSGQGVELEWNAVSQESIVYLLERADTVGGDFTTIATLADNRFLDTSVLESNQEQETYFYRVVTASKKNFSVPSNTAEVTVVTSLTNDIFEQSITIFPNPTDGLFKIEFKEACNEPLELQIVTLNGQIIFQQNIVSTQSEIILDASSYPQGVYIIQLRSGEQFTQRKIVKL